MVAKGQTMGYKAEPPASQQEQDMKEHEEQKRLHLRDSVHQPRAVEVDPIVLVGV